MSEWNRNLTNATQVLVIDQDQAMTELERCIDQQTSGRIQDLKVQAIGEGILLSGRTSTYYMKQLATQIAIDFDATRSLENSIEVI